MKILNQQNLNNRVQGLHPAKGSRGKQTKPWLWAVFFVIVVSLLQVQSSQMLLFQYLWRKVDEVLFASGF